MPLEVLLQHERARPPAAPDERCAPPDARRLLRFGPPRPRRARPPLFRQLLVRRDPLARPRDGILLDPPSGALPSVPGAGPRRPVRVHRGGVRAPPLRLPVRRGRADAGRQLRLLRPALAPGAMAPRRSLADFVLDRGGSDRRGPALLPRPRRPLRAGLARAPRVGRLRRSPLGRSPLRRRDPGPTAPAESFLAHAVSWAPTACDGSVPQGWTKNDLIRAVRRAGRGLEDPRPPEDNHLGEESREVETRVGVERRPPRRMEVLSGRRDPRSLPLPGRPPSLFHR